MGWRVHARSRVEARERRRSEVQDWPRAAVLLAVLHGLVLLIAFDARARLDGRGLLAGVACRSQRAARAKAPPASRTDGAVELLPRGVAARAGLGGAAWAEAAAVGVEAFGAEQGIALAALTGVLVARSRGLAAAAGFHVAMVARGARAV